MIRVQNLDEAYAQTVSLFNTENNDGIELLGKMDTLIANPKEHWIGEDGTKHINRLIDIHDKLQKFIEVTLENTRDAMVSVVNIQELRRSNGGGGEVGQIKQVSSDFVKNIAKVDISQKAQSISDVIHTDLNYIYKDKVNLVFEHYATFSTRFLSFSLVSSA